MKLNLKFLVNYNANEICYRRSNLKYLSIDLLHVQQIDICMFTAIFFNCLKPKLKQIVSNYLDLKECVDDNWLLNMILSFSSFVYYE